MVSAVHVRLVAVWPRIWFVLLTLYGLALLAVTGINLAGAEHWWLGALNLYLPQALWAVPGALLLLSVPEGRRRWAWLPVLGLAWVLGPVMGLRWSAQAPAAQDAPVLRVMTCNAKYGLRDTRALLRDIEAYRPGLVLLQDADGFMQGPLAPFFQGWQVRSFDQYVVASRYPLMGLKLRSIPFPGEPWPVLRCQLDLGGARVAVYDVHLQSPRDSLNAFRTDDEGRWHPFQAIRELEESAAIRLRQASLLRGWIEAEPGPVLLAGDLNSPEPSRVCATLKAAGLQDAFSQGGRGYGYTYGHFLLLHRLPWLRVSWMRLDHLMASPELRAVRCWVGTAKASDHRPVLADLVLEPAGRR